jgi:hypothetical protein
VNPDVYNASQKLESWLSLEGIAGKSICSKAPLSIKAVLQVYKISDSNDLGDDDNCQIHDHISHGLACGIG